MFSFFRKSRKDPKAAEPPAANPADDEDGSKKKGNKNEKKSSSKDKKVSFKVEHPEPAAAPPSVAVSFHENKVAAALPINAVISDSDAIPFQMGNGIFQRDDPPDVFCEAQETLQTENYCRLPTVSSFATDDVTISKVATSETLSPLNLGVVERGNVVNSSCDVNPRSLSDESECKPSVTIEQREDPQMPTLSEETPQTSLEIPSIFQRLCLSFKMAQNTTNNASSSREWRLAWC